MLFQYVTPSTQVLLTPHHFQRVQFSRSFIHNDRDVSVSKS